MVITAAQKNLLYELYGATPQDEVYISPSNNVASNTLRLPASFRATRPIVDQIEAAIPSIEADAGVEARVVEILTAYSSDSLDASNIDREGYSFRLSKNLRNYRNLLRPYTGIFFEEGTGGGTTPIG